LVNPGKAVTFMPIASMLCAAKAPEENNTKAETRIIFKYFIVF
jgi:hypothetical protein